MSIEKFLEEKVSKIKISLLIYLFIYLIIIYTRHKKFIRYKNFQCSDLYSKNLKILFLTFY